MSPQNAWENQLSVQAIDLSHLDDLVDTPVVVESIEQPAAPSVVSSATNQNITPEQIRLYKEVEMEAAVQRVLSRLAGERI